MGKTMRVVQYLAVVATVVLLAACKQSQGERCQLGADCEEGLICCVKPTAIQIGGTCQPAAGCEQTQDAGVRDGGRKDATSGDLLKTDALKSDGPKKDGPKSDGPKPDAAKPDAAKPDAAKPDTGAKDAATTDGKKG